MPANPQYATLTPNQVTTLDFTAATAGSPAVVKIYTDGAVSNRVYFTADGTTPVVDGAGTWCLLGGSPGYKTITLTGLAGVKAVKLLSAGPARTDPSGGTVRIPLSSLLVKDNIPAGASILVIASLVLLYRNSGEDAEPVVVREVGDGLYRILDGRHRFMASIIAGRPDILEAEEAPQQT